MPRIHHRAISSSSCREIDVRFFFFSLVFPWRPVARYEFRRCTENRRQARNYQPWRPAGRPKFFFHRPTDNERKTCQCDSFGTNDAMTWDSLLRYRRRVFAAPDEFARKLEILRGYVIRLEDWSITISTFSFLAYVAKYREPPVCTDDHRKKFECWDSSLLRQRTLSFAENGRLCKNCFVKNRPNRHKTRRFKETSFTVLTLRFRI